MTMTTEKDGKTWVGYFDAGLMVKALGVYIDHCNSEIKRLVEIDCHASIKPICDEAIKAEILRTTIVSNGEQLDIYQFDTGESDEESDNG